MDINVNFYFRCKWHEENESKFCALGNVKRYWYALVLIYIFALNLCLSIRIDVWLNERSCRIFVAELYSRMKINNLISRQPTLWRAYLILIGKLSLWLKILKQATIWLSKGHVFLFLKNAQINKISFINTKSLSVIRKVCPWLKIPNQATVWLSKGDVFFLLKNAQIWNLCLSVRPSARLIFL